MSRIGRGFRWSDLLSVTIQFLYGGEGGIRTVSGLRRTVTCRIHVAAVASNTSIAVAHRPISPDDYVVRSKSKASCEASWLRFVMEG